MLRFDLEGDGTDEVAITAKRMVDGDPSPRIGAGDYALVALRRLAGGVVHTLLLEGEFYPEAHEFAAPNEFTLTNVLDLNGDGRMEIVVDSRYYEGFAVAVFDITAAGARGVLGAGCGA